MITLSKSSIRTGLTETSRMVRTGQGQCMTDGEAIARVCSAAFAPSCATRLAVERERYPTGLAGASVVADSFNELLADEVVLVRVTYPWEVVAPMLRPFYGDDRGNHPIRETFVFKNEGFQRVNC